MYNVKRTDNQGKITPLGELLTCPLCGEPFILAYDNLAKKTTGHLFKPSCNCIKKDIGISVG